MSLKFSNILCRSPAVCRTAESWSSDYLKECCNPSVSRIQNIYFYSRVVFFCNTTNEKILPKHDIIISLDRLSCAILNWKTKSVDVDERCHFLLGSCQLLEGRCVLVSALDLLFHGASRNWEEELWNIFDKFILERLMLFSLQEKSESMSKALFFLSFILQRNRKSLTCPCVYPAPSGENRK